MVEYLVFPSQKNLSYWHQWHSEPLQVSGEMKSVYNQFSVNFSIIFSSFFFAEQARCPRSICWETASGEKRSVGPQMGWCKQNLYESMNETDLEPCKKENIKQGENWNIVFVLFPGQSRPVCDDGEDKDVHLPWYRSGGAHHQLWTDLHLWGPTGEVCPPRCSTQGPREPNRWSHGRLGRQGQ